MTVELKKADLTRAYRHVDCMRDYPKVAVKEVSILVYTEVEMPVRARTYTSIRFPILATLLTPPQSVVSSLP